MGTSTSSSGSPGGSGFDPPWLETVSQTLASRLAAQGLGDPLVIEPLSGPVGEAPARRFVGAKAQLHDFARTGDRSTLRRALGHYARTGMGGARNVARRMRPSTVAAASLSQLLNAARERSDPRIVAWLTTLVARSPSADDVAAEIVRQLTTTGGTLEEESCRRSMAEALGELLEQQPGTDLLALSAEDVWVTIELFLSREAFNRLLLEIGQLFEGVNISPVEVVRRTNEMRDYIRSEVIAQIRPLRIAVQNPTPSQLEHILQDALQNTFAVFESVL